MLNVEVHDGVFLLADRTGAILIAAILVLLLLVFFLLGLAVGRGPSSHSHDVASYQRGASPATNAPQPPAPKGSPQLPRRTNHAVLALGYVLAFFFFASGLWMAIDGSGWGLGNMCLGVVLATLFWSLRRSEPGSLPKAEARDSSK